MSVWVTLKEDDILSGIGQEEREDFATASTGSFVADRLIPLMRNFSEEIRGYVQTHAPDAVSIRPGTIPPEFIDRAVDYIRFKLLTSVAGYQPGEARQLTYEKAESYFMKVAEGKILPAKADDAVAPVIAEARSQALPRVLARSKRFSRDQQNGI